VRLNSTLLCACIGNYYNCFKNLICDSNGQAIVGPVCNSLLVADQAKCGVSIIPNCNFKPLPSLPSLTCGSEKKCDTCSLSSNCQWCGVNLSGTCIPLGQTCQTSTTDNVSNLYAYSGGKCENNVNDIIKTILLKNAEFIAALKTDEVINAAGIAIGNLNVGAQISSDVLSIGFNIGTSNPLSLNDYPRICSTFKIFASQHLGVTDMNRIKCDPKTFTKKRVIQTTVSGTVSIGQPANMIAGDYAGGLNVGPNTPPPPTGGKKGGGLSAGAIAGIVIGVIAIIIVLILIVTFFVLRSSNGDDSRSY